MEPDERTGAATRGGQLVRAIRADIAANRFPPGSRLTEAALADAYGISRTPVREALRILTQEMLLDHVPNWGHRVARLELRDLDDLYAVRVGIEQQTVRRLAEGSGDLGPVHELLDIWGDPDAAVDTDADLIFADESFHEGLAAAAGGTVLLTSLRSINRRLHALRMREFVDIDRVRRTYDQHTQILRAILDADVTLAVAFMASHVLEGQRYVRRSALQLGLLDPPGPDDVVDGAPPVTPPAGGGSGSGA